MFDVNADPSVVTATIERDLAEARQESAQRLAEAAQESSAAVAAEDSVAVQVVPVAPSATPVDADAAFRRGRLGIVAALVLVLLWVWIVQRRNEGMGK